MSERFGPVPGNARLAQRGQQDYAINSEPRLMNGAPVSRLGLFLAALGIADDSIRTCPRRDSAAADSAPARLRPQ